MFFSIDVLRISPVNDLKVFSVNRRSEGIIFSGRLPLKNT